MSSRRLWISGCIPEAATPAQECSKIFLFHVQSERQLLPVKLLQEAVVSAENVRKQFILAVVDGGK